MTEQHECDDEVCASSDRSCRMSFLRYALFTVPLVLLLGTVSGRVAEVGLRQCLVRRARQAGDHAAGLGVRSGLDHPLHPARPRAGPDPPRPRRPRPRPRRSPCSSPSFCSTSPGRRSSSPITRSEPAFWTIVAMIADLGGRGDPVLADPALRGLLMLPYLAWLGFAASLTWQIGRAQSRRPQSLRRRGDYRYRRSEAMPISGGLRCSPKTVCSTISSRS